jgi:hypothetical protein
VGLNLSEHALAREGTGSHYGLASSWAPLYGLLRRRAHLGGPVSAVVTGAAMSAVADETLTPLLGFSGVAPIWSSASPSVLSAKRCGRPRVAARR